MDKFSEDFKKHLSSLDWLLIGAAVLANIYGLFLIKSATNGMGTVKYVVVQAVASVLGLAVMLFISRLDYFHYAKYMKYIYAAAAAAMAATLAVSYFRGDLGQGYGIRFFGIGVQTPEIIKVFYIFCLAAFLDRIREDKNSLKNAALLVLFSVVMVGLVFLDNPGTGLVFLFITLAMCFIAGLSLWYFLALAGVSVAASPFVWNFMSDYQKMRIIYAFNPEKDPIKWGYQVIWSKRAIGSGGLLGSGFQHGYITQQGIIPEQQTDFIFSAAGEEFGFLGAALMVALLAFIVVRIFIISHQARNNAGFLICVGAFALFAAQSAENIGMCIGMMPVVGVTLPFFSYGGSSIVGCYMALGLVMSVYSGRYKYYFNREE